jgi:hypothetical protein
MNIGERECPVQEVDHGGADDKREYAERYADPDEAVFNEPPGAFPVQRAGREVSGDEEEGRQDPGPADAHEDVENDIGDGIIEMLIEVPAACWRVSQAYMVEDHKEGEGEPEVVEVQHAFRARHGLRLWEQCSFRADLHTGSFIVPYHVLDFNDYIGSGFRPGSQEKHCGRS